MVEKKEVIITIPSDKNLIDYYTKKEIDTKKNYVALLTLKDDKIMEQEYFSIESFKKWRDDKAKEVAMNMLNTTLGALMKYLKQNKHLFQGLTNLFGEDKKDSIQLNEIYIHDGEKKKNKKGKRKNI